MAEERTVFDRLDKIESDNETSKKMLEDILNEIKNEKNGNHKLEKRIEPKQNDQEIFLQFLRGSKKYRRFFGSYNEFNREKGFAIFSIIVSLIIGLVATVVSSISFRMYSTFTFFENAWMVCCIFYLIYDVKAKQLYDAEAMASNSSKKYLRDEIGMPVPVKEKLMFRIFKWCAIFSPMCNIVAVWVGLGKSLNVPLTIIEAFYLLSVFAILFTNMIFYDDYSIIWVEGKSFLSGEYVTLVRLPASKSWMLESDFKKKFPVMFNLE